MALTRSLRPSRRAVALLAAGGLAAAPLLAAPAGAHELAVAPYGQPPLYDYPYAAPSSPFGGLGQLLGMAGVAGVPLSPEQQVARCNTGRLVGGLLGGSAGYAMSRRDGRAWAVPLGALLGSQVGCSAAMGRGPQPW